MEYLICLILGTTSQTDRQTDKVTLRRVRVTVVVEWNLYILSV